MVESRRILRWAGVVIAAALMAGCGADQQELYVIKFPHVVAPATPKGQSAQRFKELAEARFPGRVSIEVYPSGQLMEDSDSLEALAFGEIQMIAVSVSVLDRLTTRFQVFDLPFLFSDIESVERFQRSPTGQMLLDALNDEGMLGIAFWHNGMKQLGGPRPLRLPSDAAGLKFRVMESDILQAQVQAFGGSPQKMAFGEVYQALQTGAVDAQENTWSNMYSSRFYEVQPYITVTNHGYIGYFVAVNRGFWESLPEDLRIGLGEILAEVTEWNNERSAEINAADRRRIGESGRTEIIELTPAELEAWRQTMTPVWEQFRDVIGADLIDAAQSSAAAP
jgi:C4-dicarboxylate-binding protein DctP